MYGRKKIHKQKKGVKGKNGGRERKSNNNPLKERER